MANLKSLIRFRKFEVDEKQRVLSALYEEAYKFEKRKSDILDTIQKETKIAKEIASFEILKQLGIYVQGAKLKLDELNQALERLNLRIELAQNDLRLSFSEMKKIELLHGRRLKVQRIKNEAREEATMNEIGIVLYNQNNIS